jgi:hypothetical protein
VKESKEMIEKIQAFKNVLQESEEDTGTVSLSTRIAKEAYRITLSLNPDSLMTVTLAMSILNQAQAIVGNDAALALRLYNRARIIARKR